MKQENNNNNTNNIFDTPKKVVLCKNGKPATDELGNLIISLTEAAENGGLDLKSSHFKQQAAMSAWWYRYKKTTYGWFFLLS